MALLNGHDILAAGWPPGPHISKILDAVRELEARGIFDRDYALKLLRRDFPPPPSKLEMRHEPADLAEAIEATGPDDESNVGAVRRLMNELLRTPVIERSDVLCRVSDTGERWAFQPSQGFRRHYATGLNSSRVRGLKAHGYLPLPRSGKRSLRRHSISGCRSQIFPWQAAEFAWLFSAVLTKVAASHEDFSPRSFGCGDCCTVLVGAVAPGAGGSAGKD